MKIYSKIAIVIFVICFEAVVFNSVAHAITGCRKEMAMMRQIKKRFSAPKGELYYALVRGANRKSAIWKACGYIRNGKSTAAARKKAMGNCKKHSDSCKIIAQFRWTQKKCPSRRCYVRLP